jgi:hypothetical protein
MTLPCVKAMTELGRPVGNILMDFVYFLHNINPRKKKRKSWFFDHRFISTLHILLSRPKIKNI